MYIKLKKLAQRQMANQPPMTVIQPTILVHETWLKLSKTNTVWKNQNHFLATATTTMRSILIDYIRKKDRKKHGGNQIRETLDVLDKMSENLPNQNILLINEGISELEKINPERAGIVIDRFFGGLSHKEISANLGISERSVDRHWAAAKIWLYRWMRLTRTNT
jgi:RNA polymerase sigma factor (TIGR02999 family)